MIFGSPVRGLGIVLIILGASIFTSHTHEKLDEAVEPLPKSTLIGASLLPAANQAAPYHRIPYPTPALARLGTMTAAAS